MSKKNESKPLKLNRIKQGDCIKQMSKLPDGCVQLVFADPPFNIGYEYDVYEDKKSADDYLAWSEEWMRQVHRVLADNGTFWLAIGDEFAAELKIAAQRKIGFQCRSWVIWYYTFGVNCKRGFSRSHTHLFHFTKSGEDFVFNADDPAVRVPSARQLVYADKRANPKGRLPDNTWILRPQDLPGGFQPDDDTWYYPRVAGTFKEREGFHGCQMPEQLLGRIIRLCSNEGDVVMDPFAGSGTTLTVAKKLARDYVGFELSKEYVTHVKKRLKGAEIGAALDGAENPLQSAPSTRNGKQRGKAKTTKRGAKGESAKQSVAKAAKKDGNDKKTSAKSAKETAKKVEKKSAKESAKKTAKKTAKKSLKKDGRQSVKKSARKKEAAATPMLF